MRTLQRAPRTMTGADGTFAMTGLEPGEYTLTARREQYGDSAPFVVTCAQGETVDEISLVLTQGEVLRGRVVTARDEAPVEGALVFVPRGDAPGIVASDVSGGTPVAPPDSVHTTTGPSGDFVLEGLTAGAVTVQIRHLDFAPATLGSVEVPGTDVTIELSAGGAVQGYLRDKERRPIAGRQIMLTQGAMGSGGMRSAQTDPEGFYRIDRIRPGGYQLMFTDPKSPFGVSGMTNVTLRDGQTVHHDFGPKGGTRPISGSVVQGGEPLEGATVFLTGGGGDMKFGQTDADGRFRFDGVEPGEYTVVVQREMMGGGNVSEKVTVAGDGEVPDVRIEVPDLTLAGTVVDAESGEPVAMAQIELLREGAGGATSIEEMVEDTAGRGFTDERGRFELRGVEEGVFRLRVTAAGFAQLTLEGVRSGAADVRVRLGRGAELVVTVLDPAGKPVARANVSAVDAAGVETAMFDMTMSGLTGSDGKATLRLGAGRYTLQVDAAEYPPASVEVESQSGAATVRLVAGGTLDVTVTGPDGKPVVGAEVEVRDASGKPIRRRISIANFGGSTARTDASGSVQRTGLVAGQVTVAVKLAAGGEVSQPAKIVAGDTTAVSIQLR
jgi:protocatechuate 3,4-dioxygenase beta subunit